MSEKRDQPSGEPEPESPSPSAPPSPSPGPSDGSPGDSSAANGGGHFVGNPGPEFDAEEAGDAPAPEPVAGELHSLPEPPPIWEEPTVRSILVAQGSAAHSLAGVGEQDWTYTETDLLAIAPPLTRILNRYPATRAAAGTGDELALAIGLGGYVTRSYRERRDVLAAAADEEEQPITGRAAPAGTGPPAPEPKPKEGEPLWRTDQ